MKKFNIKWYYNRLKSMSFLELVYRIINYFMCIIEKSIILKLKQKPINFKKFNNFYFDDFKCIIDFYEENSEYRDNVFKNADLVCEHKLSFFKFKNQYFGEKIDWHKDYLNEKAFPLLFYGDLDFKHNTDKNIKYTWELNRFQHLFPLSQAFVLSNDNKYADEILFQINDWIDQNPLLIGINWTSPIEISLRLISWLWSLYILEKNNYQYSEKLKEKISTSIFQQTEYIYRHLSLFSSANGHLIAEAIGLVFVGTVLDYGAYSLKWKRKGLKILLKEINEQFYDDGLNKEQAFGYHCLALNMLLITLIILEKNNLNISKEYWNKIEKMIECIYDFSDNNLNLPNYGDSDDSYILKLDNYFDNESPTKQNARFLLNAAAIIFNRNDFKSIINKVDEISLWIFGKEEIEQYNKLQIGNIKKISRYFNQSGYMIFKDEDVNAYMDVGQHGYLSIAAHAHADALSFCLNYKNKQFLVDSGTYAYKRGNTRDFFRSTSAHNTILVDNLNQSESGGPFIWNMKAQTTTEKVLINKSIDYIKAFHNGYIKQGTKVKHTREILFQKNSFFIILDKIKSYDKKEHEYTLNWHVHNTCEIINNINEFIIIQEKDSLFMNILSNKKINTNITESIFSVNFGAYTKNSTISSSIKTLGGMLFITIISFDEDYSATYSKDILKIIFKGQTFTYNTTKRHLYEK